MVAVTAAAAVIGAVVSIAGARAQAKAQAKAAKLNAAIADRNAQTADISGEFRETIAGAQNVRFREQFDRLQRAVGVAYAKGGIDPQSGTARVVALENARQADEESAIRAMQVSAEVSSYHDAGVNARLQGDLQRIYAKGYTQSGKWKQLGAFTQGVGGVAGAFGGGGGYSGGGTGSSLMSSGFTGGRPVNPKYGSAW
jgi:hypothetical protein